MFGPNLEIDFPEIQLFFENLSKTQEIKWKQKKSIFSEHMFVSAKGLTNVFGCGKIWKSTWKIKD